MNTAFINDLNWIAILCGALGYFALGALWYSKILFAKKWIELTNVDASDPNATKGMGLLMFISLIWMFVTSLGIAVIRERVGDISGWMGGVKLGTLTGLCFGVASISISYLYEKRSSGLHWINGGYTLLGNIIAAVVVCSWHN
ncbi:hypothetical protein BH11BAC4_BH11BAC4_24160 [soil metagenome]